MLCATDCQTHGETSAIHESSTISEKHEVVADVKLCCSMATHKKSMIVGTPKTFFVILKNFMEIEKFCNEMNDKHSMLQIIETACVGLNSRAKVVFGADFVVFINIQQ